MRVFADATAWSGSKPADVVGNFYQCNGKTPQSCVRCHHGIKGTLRLEFVWCGRKWIACQLIVPSLRKIACRDGANPAAKSLLVLDPDSLWVYESVRPEMRKLAAITAVLDAADGNTWVR